MKTWTLGAVSGLVGVVAFSSIGCAGSSEEPEAARAKAEHTCVNPSTGETAPAKVGNKIWQDDWLAPVTVECPLGMEESAPPPAEKK